MSNLRGDDTLPGMTHLFTVGHSTHPIEEFVGILRAHGVTLVADIRTVPRSRHNPQFNEGELTSSLPAHDLAYRRIPALGGLRKAHTDSVNAGWKNASFRGYADYMQTPEFADAVEDLGNLLNEASVAIMCAEAVPWRCHRSLVGDAMIVRGISVDDIFSATSAKPHALTSFARADGLSLTYPSPTEEE